MSSYSEYLNRMKQRLPTYTDTRPHRDAGHQTEIVKRLAASGNLESRVAATSCSNPLDASTRNTVAKFRSNGGHNVQDTTDYLAYTAGQAVARGAIPSNTKPSQIQNVCYSSTTIPEKNDILAADAQLSLIQAQKNAYARGYMQNCCSNCKKVLFASSCACTNSLAPKHTVT